MHISQLDLMTRFINGDGEPCNYGCSENEVPALIEIGRQRFPGKPYRVVRKWAWGDLEVKESLATLLAQNGFSQTFIYSSEIIEDEKDPMDKGLCVKSSLLVEFSNNAIFVTKNTVYILVGPGTRMTVPEDGYFGLVF